MQSTVSMMRMCHYYIRDGILTHFAHISRKSDIENERLPPELVDADSEEGKAYMSQPPTPSEESYVPPPANGVAAALEEAISNGTISPGLGPHGPTSPISPTSSNSPFRRGHGRQASLGTTMTSPSTRRRSLESTMSLLKEAVDGKEADAEFEQLVDQVAGRVKEKENAAPLPR